MPVINFELKNSDGRVWRHGLGEDGGTGAKRRLRLGSLRPYGYRVAPSIQCFKFDLKLEEPRDGACTFEQIVYKSVAYTK